MLLVLTSNSPCAEVDTVLDPAVLEANLSSQAPGIKFQKSVGREDR